PPEIAALAGKDTKVTLSLEKTSLDRVFKALGEQAGFKPTFRGYTPVVSVNFSGRGLEDVLGDLHALYGLLIRAQGPDRLDVRAPLAVGVAGVGRPTIKRKKDPELADDRTQRLFGKVVLQVVVCEDGSVGAIAVGPGTQEPKLISPAQDAVRQWIFEPAQKDGKPVAVSLTTSVEFLPE
ncbi:MAG TPA: energy transducer TonB, partial [Candidatus Polarisedimenticolaceae bacterium]|nr:energy transducer TonB [Candidatus Polarisedimenticolaceae bacterium]